MQLYNHKNKGLRSLSLLDVMQDGEEKTYVVFQNSNDPRWYNKFCPDGFQHCWILHFDGVFWHKIEQTYPRLNTEIISVLDNFAFNQSMNISRYYQALDSTTVIAVKRVDQDKNQLRQLIPFDLDTCVSCVKRFIGINARTVITPFQLYKHLHKRG